MLYNLATHGYLPAKSRKKSSVLKISPSPAPATSFRAIVDFPLRLVKIKWNSF